jgi:biopolymer transport protein ExbD
MSKKKKKKNKPDQPDKVASFGLNEPTGQFANLEEEMAAKKAAKVQPQQTVVETSVPNVDDLDYRNMGWKGIDAEPEEEVVDDVAFGEKEPIPEDELDMTPMVDVTFLLLIFFMVTASFTLQKSLEQPHSSSDKPSANNVEEEEIVDDYVQVTIDQTNTFYVTTRDEEEREAPSDNEMRALVRDGKDSSSARRLIIVAHVDSLHSKVVTAWDAGVVNGMEQIEIETTEEDY